MSGLQAEVEIDTWQEWGKRLRDAPEDLDFQIHVRKELDELLRFSRMIAMFRIAPSLRTALFVPFETGWNRYVNLIAMEIETNYNRMMGEPAASDEELEHQWALSGLKRL